LATVKYLLVILAQAGIQFRTIRFAAISFWIPAYARMTEYRSFGPRLHGFLLQRRHAFNQPIIGTTGAGVKI
jgi:hypothetical protein